jgi:hypothetical protein
VLCVALALRGEVGIHPQYVKRMDAFMTGLKKQVAFKMTGLRPMVHGLESQAQAQSKREIDQDE